MKDKKRFNNCKYIFDFKFYNLFNYVFNCYLHNMGIYWNFILSYYINNMCDNWKSILSRTYFKYISKWFYFTYHKINNKDIKKIVTYSPADSVCLFDSDSPIYNNVFSFIVLICLLILVYFFYQLHFVLFVLFCFISFILMVLFSFGILFF